MKEKVEMAVKSLTTKATECEKSDDALRYSQAALNLAHAFATLEGTKELTR